MSKLSEKQKAFADYYIESLNAYEAAIKAGYKENYAKAQSYKLLDNVGIKNYISERLKAKETDRIASQNEVLEYLTNVIRGNIKEYGYDSEGNEYAKEVAIRDKTKAAELLGKRYKLFVDKVEQETTGETTINNKIDLSNFSYEQLKELIKDE